MLCLKLKQTSCSNVTGKRHTHCTKLTIKPAIAMSIKGKQNGHEAVQKGYSYHHGVWKSKNTSAYPLDRTTLLKTRIMTAI